VARGAVDDKGQVMTFIEAFRAWMAAHGSLPLNVTIIIEGEEESGSRSLDAFLKENKDELQADVCVVSDTGMWDIDTPAITSSLRGLVYAEVTLHGPSHDLHSGMYGGSLVNPLNALCSVLGSLHDEKRRVRIPGFYDDVAELDARQRQQWQSLGFDEREFLGSAGMKTPFGEADRTTLERIWSRPTCDINGLWGGYTGQGAKTVIGSKASAKVSCRLVPDQDPRKVQEGLASFLNQRTPPDCRWEIHWHGASPAIRVPTDSPHLKAAARGLKAIFGREPVLIGSGGSIPVVGSIERLLGFDSLLVGFGLDDDRVHSPNEKFELRCFANGIRSHAAIMAELAGVTSARPGPRAAAASPRAR
jgi:acetylornithine deacetylase/succinyl-diaminopimelate desuccinylase-like protein